MKGSKRFGPQTCDNCGREFTVRSSGEWECPHCGMDNKAGAERLSSIGRAAAARRKRKTEGDA